jgi:hypothetical protein
MISIALIATARTAAKTRIAREVAQFSAIFLAAGFFMLSVETYAATPWPDALDWEVRAGEAAAAALALTPYASLAALRRSSKSRCA